MIGGDDFKYAAINAALREALQYKWGEPARSVLSGVLEGTVPVVDGTSVLSLMFDDESRFSGIADAHRDRQQKSNSGWPLNMFVLYARFPEGFDGQEDVSSIVVFCEMSSKQFVLYLCGQKASSMGTYARRFDPSKTQIHSDWVRHFSGLITSLCRCLASWMSTKNAEFETESVPRHFRRRHEHLASVRFRRVFIRPPKKNADRYEITGEKCPLHHVRGYYMIVHRDRPLFGNFNSDKCWGDIWVSEHWKGNEKNGLIVQEYVATDPEGDEERAIDDAFASDIDTVKTAFGEMGFDPNK